jgi:hypothetical protein
MSTFSKLELAPACRPGELFPGGSYKTERRFLDFVVDGRSLYDVIRSKNVDNISPLWIGEADPNGARVAAIISAKRLMLMEPADFPNNRRSLFICAECGDLGCGAVSVLVERLDDTITWRDFGYEKNWEEKLWTENYEDMGPFTFRSSEYYQVLNDVISQLQ